MKLSEKGRSVTMEMSFWMTEDGAIHLTSNDRDVKTFHVAIRSDQTKASGQPYLYRELARCLKQMGAPAPGV
jgi:hypothetical protein